MFKYGEWEVCLLIKGKWVIRREWSCKETSCTGFHLYNDQKTNIIAVFDKEEEANDIAEKLNKKD